MKKLTADQRRRAIAKLEKYIRNPEHRLDGSPLLKCKSGRSYLISGSNNLFYVYRNHGATAQMIGGGPVRTVEGVLNSILLSEKSTF